MNFGINIVDSDVIFHILVVLKWNLSLWMKFWVILWLWWVWIMFLQSNWTRWLFCVYVLGLIWVCVFNDEWCGTNVTNFLFCWREFSGKSSFSLEIVVIWNEGGKTNATWNLWLDSNSFGLKRVKDEKEQCHVNLDDYDDAFYLGG